MTKFNFTKLALVCITVLFFLYSCTKDGKLSPDNLNESNSAIASKGSVKSTSSFGDYEIGVNVSADGKVWTYTITPKKGAKNLSHFIIDLNNCGLESATFANIVSATVNGAPADLTPTEGSGTGCNPQATTSNFVKINTAAASSWVIVITFERGYQVVEAATAWVKAGTSCTKGTIKAPGCPVEDYCSFSQGFFFANGSYQNGASDTWNIAGLTIGGVLYSQADGTKFWGIDKGAGGNQTMNGFFQLGAVRLSGVESEVAAHAAIIDTYFTGLDVNTAIATGYNGPNSFQYFNLPATSNGITKAQVIAAGSAISAYIDANHCE